MKNATVGLRELRENIENYINQVNKGKSFIVLRRSKPVLKISSPDDEESWETVVDFTEFSHNGVSAKEVLRQHTNTKNTKQQFTAVYKKQGKWYLGWIEEIPGVNTQGKNLKETKENLREALHLILGVNKALYKNVSGHVIKEPIAISY